MPQQQLFSSISFMVIVFGAMYFFMIRPSQKKQKEVNKMRENLKVGDNIITIGGIKGKVIKIGDDFVVIESSNSKTKLEFVKSAVGTVIANEANIATEKDEEKEEK